MMRKAWPDLGAFLLLLLLPLLLYGPVALGPRTLLPADVLYTFEPYRTAAPDLGITHPQNHLVADLILENYAWKQFIVRAMQDRELPLWDPYIFAGHPFLANGQHSALYPPSVIFYVLPLWRAYGVFVWLQLGLAGGFAYLLARVLSVSRLGGLVTGITFQFCGFLIVSAAAHPMIVAGASWLPFLLAMIELIVQQRPLFGRPTTLPWMLLGAAGVGCQIWVGHGENTYFTFLVMGLYTLWRLVRGWREAGGLTGWWIRSRRALVWLAAMVGLGLALGAVQLVPYVEVVNGSFRSGEAAATLEQVLGWAYPPRRLLTFGIPHFFGGPTQHGYFDLFTWRWTSALTFPDGQYIDWGVKNYVEGGAYLGLLPLFLAVIAVLRWLASSARRIVARGGSRPALPADHSQRVIPFFALLSLFSLGCIFGTPLYALVYALPGLEQSHSPFRWVFPLSLSVAVLAGLGIEAVRRSRNLHLGQGMVRRARHPLANLLLLDTSPSLVTLFAVMAFWGGLATLTGLVLSRLFFVRIEPLIARVFLALAKAPEAFPDHRAFYSYEFRWVALFGLLLMGTGIVLRVSRCPIYLRRRRGGSGGRGRPVWEILALGLLVLDLASWGAGFHPAVDPALLDYVPPVVEFLKQDESTWRYATFTPPGTTKTMNANVGMFYELQAVAGYDSLFTRRYADYMGLIEAQDERQYNRIASFRQWSSLDSPLTDLLNVKYIVTEVEIPNPKYRLAYQDEAVRVYQNLSAMPRAYTMPLFAALETDDFGATVQSHDPRRYVMLEPGAYPLDAYAPQPGEAVPQTVTRHTINEVKVDVQAAESGWLVLTDAYFPGWKGFIRPQGAGEEAEEQVPVYRVNSIFRGVLLQAPGAYTVRFKYSPDSVKIGAFITFIAGMVILFLIGIYVWRFFYREEPEGETSSTVKRVAKNSIAPIVLNLFNQAILFAFAALMARILGPEGTGRYDTAVVIYGWFETVANFGLDMYLMREVARDREMAWRVFVNTTVLRLLLFLGILPLLGSFLAGRQGVGTPLDSETVWAVLLLYAGLLPGSVANGLAALFRGCEKHEYPAAIQTVTAIIRVTLGVLVLVGGLGVVGVAAASILTNAATLAILAVLARRLIWAKLPRTRGKVARPLLRRMLTESWPLMAALLLQLLFPGVNALLLQYFHGDAAVGWYGAGRKWVDALNIVPAFFTMAVFPVVSRLAAEDRKGLLRSYRLSVKLLTLVALPTAVLVTLLAPGLVGLLSGREFLPQGARVLQVLIWSILFGWVNSLTNYVLIALDRQRYVLVASGGRVIFTVAANLLLVPALGYVASAWILVGGELLLVALFGADLRRQVGPLAWGRTLGRVLLAGLAMGAVVLLMAPVSRPLALLVGLTVYPAAVALLQVLTVEERALLVPLLPARLRQAIVGQQAAS